MSNLKVFQAKLKDYSGPFFPEVLGRIQKRYAYHWSRFNNILFDEIADRSHSGRMISHPATSDVKSRRVSPWSHAIEFKRRGRTYRVYFPVATDSDKEHGTFAVRHVALYCKDGEPSADELELVAREFVEVFDSTYKEQYATAIKDSKAKKAQE